jgi:hypothetical protein
MLQALTGPIQAAAAAAEAVLYCKRKAARINTRLQALVPALRMFHDGLRQHAALAAAQEKEHLQALNDNLLCLLQVGHMLVVQLQCIAAITGHG